MLYYGKLRKHREFLYAKNLQDRDRQFFDHWYNRCHNSNSLMPFLEKKQNNKIWLFIVISNHQLYIGLTTISQDLSGRLFPFTCFDILYISEKNFSENIFISNQKITNYIQKIPKFIHLIQDGKLSHSVLESFNMIDEAHKTLLPSEPSKFLTNITENSDFSTSDQSCWLEVKTGYFINYQNSLTCSLYNKIYG